MPETPAEFPAELLNAPVRFWICINREHKNVTWDGDVATCPDCGLTSEMTKRYAALVRVMVADKIERALAEDGDGSSWDGGMANAARIARGGAS